MVPQLDRVIKEVEAQKKAEQEAQQAELAERNRERVEQAIADLRMVLGPLSEVLEGMIVHRDTATEKGLLVQAEWTFFSEEHQIAPIRLNWHAAGQRYGMPISYIEAYVADGKNGESWKGKVTPEIFGEILYKARSAYEDYRAKVEEEAKKLQRERQKKIDDLQWGWSVGWEESYVIERVERLKALGASDLADQRLAEWRTNVLRAQEEEKRREEKRADEAAAWAEYRRQVEEWQAACAVWAEQENARLWQPWALWKVRYVPFDVSLIHTEYDEERVPEFIQEIYTLDDPAYIAKQRAVVSLRRVKGDGTVTPGYAIACFLDAEPIYYNEPTSNHHRCYWAGESVVCVPPFVSEEPEPGPARPKMPKEVEDIPF